MKVKAKAKYNLTENKMFIPAGTVFEIEGTRAKQLGDLITILEQIQDDAIIPENKIMPSKKVKKKNV